MATAGRCSFSLQKLSLVALNLPGFAMSTQKLQEMLHLTQHARNSCPNVLHIDSYKSEGLVRHYNNMVPASPSRSRQTWLVDPWWVHLNSGCPPHFVSPQLSCQESIGDHNVGSASAEVSPVPAV